MNGISHSKLWATGPPELVEAMEKKWKGGDPQFQYDFDARNAILKLISDNPELRRKLKRNKRLVLFNGKVLVDYSDIETRRVTGKERDKGRDWTVDQPYNAD